MIEEKRLETGHLAGRGSEPGGAALIVNVRSRKAEYVAFQALDLLNASGVAVDATRVVRDAAELPDTVHGVLAEGYGLVILGGGDGSVSSVVDAMAGSDAVLGLLPLGNANDLARTLGIPADLEWACLTVARGRVAEVDLGLVDLGLAGERHYANAACVGLGIEVVETLSPLLKRSAGALAYPAAAIRAFLRHRPFSAALTFPGGDHPPVTFERLLQVAVGNGRFRGGEMAVASGGVDDGTLDVCAVEAGRPRDLAGLVRRLGSGELVHEGCAHHYRTSRVRLDTGPPLPIAIDGELVAGTAMGFSAAPSALKVLVPEPGVMAGAPPRGLTVSPA